MRTKMAGTTASASPWTHEAPRLDLDAKMAELYGREPGPRGRKERQAVAFILDSLRAQGYTPKGVLDSDGDTTQADTTKEVMEIVFDLDDSRVLYPHGSLLFIRGNSPEEVLADYSWKDNNMGRQFGSAVDGVMEVLCEGPTEVEVQCNGEDSVLLGHAQSVPRLIGVPPDSDVHDFAGFCGFDEWVHLDARHATRFMALGVDGLTGGALADLLKAHQEVVEAMQGILKGPDLETDEATQRQQFNTLTARGRESIGSEKLEAWAKLAQVMQT